MVEQTKGAVDIALSSKGQRPELTVDLDRGLAGSLGLTVGQVAQSLRPAFAGIDAGDWVDPSGETRDVVVRLAPEARQRAEDLRQLPLLVPGGTGGAPRTVPLGQVVRVKPDIGPAVINHLDRDLVVNVEWNVQGRSSDEVMADVQRVLKTIQLPPGITFSVGGDAENQTEVYGNIFLALGVAVLLMYLILVMQFGSFLDPMAILMSLPLSLVGVMLALAVTGLTINIMSLIGVILLMGIVAKNAILLIDFAKWSHEKGQSIRDALIEAGAIRLRPILMTTFALIAGMIPVALGRGEGAQFRAAAGRGRHRWRAHLDAADAAGDPDGLRDLLRLEGRAGALVRSEAASGGGARPAPASRRAGSRLSEGGAALPPPEQRAADDEREAHVLGM